MSKIRLINASCAEQDVDAVVNAANKYLLAGGGICGVIYRKAGYKELELACDKYETPLKDGDAVITPSFGMKNTNAIIHAIGPNFHEKEAKLEDLQKAYYNSLIVLKDNKLHSISFPLISSGIFGGNLPNPPGISTKQCINAYKEFVEENPDYDIEVLLCAYTPIEYYQAQKVFQEEQVHHHVPTLTK